MGVYYDNTKVRTKRKFDKKRNKYAHFWLFIILLLVVAIIFYVGYLIEIF